MKIRLLAVGNRMPAWVQTGYEEYAKRLPRTWGFELVEIPPEKRRNVSSDTARGAEAERILARVGPSEHLVVLDETGNGLSTVTFSKTIQRWQEAGHSVCLVIGGADGLDKRCAARANESISLSALTLPHPLVRVVLAEQLYRAWSLLNNHPYHRG